MAEDQAKQPQGQEEQICPICKVKIIPALGGDRVVFSTGPEGTRTKLWEKVCQYAKKPQCINREPNAVGQVRPHQSVINSPVVNPSVINPSASNPSAVNEIDS